MKAGLMTELIQLVQADEQMGEGGEVSSNLTNLEKARAQITPLREKLETRSGGRSQSNHYRVVCYAKAFNQVDITDHFVWQTNGDKILKIDLIITRPPKDNAIEFECYLEGA